MVVLFLGVVCLDCSSLVLSIILRIIYFSLEWIRLLAVIDLFWLADVLVGTWEVLC